MSTTCTIGQLEAEGRIRAIGCWCDGCGDAMWTRLIRNYNTPERIRELLNLGDIHWLGARLAPNPGERHDFFEPADEVTLAYHRDDGKELVPARQFPDIDTFLKWADDCDSNRFGDYIYLFDGCEWLVWDEDRWRNLEVQLAYMNGKAGEPDNCFIAPCGNDCAECPRFIAIEDEELRKLAELWRRIGWRDKVVSAEEMRCGGCSVGRHCSYGMLECQAEKSVARCGDCGCHPCPKITDVLGKSDYWQRRCKDVCSPDEYAMLEHAFFHKKENLGLTDFGFTIRRFAQLDASEVQTIIHRGLREVNGKDYPTKLIEDFCAYFTIDKILSQAASAHTYVAVSDAGKIVGTGTIAPYWGSETESILLTIYVLPERIGNGIGTAIVTALEADEFFQRARRIEIPSSKTAVNFYRKMGYAPKNDNEEPDEEGIVRLEKYHHLES